MLNENQQSESVSDYARPESGKTVAITGKRDLRLEEIRELVIGRAPKVKLTEEALRRAARNRQFLDQMLEQGEDIYGVTTGFGNSSDNRVNLADSYALQTNLTRYHGCGVGPFLDLDDALAVLLVRLNANAGGGSGVSTEYLERLALLLNERIIPAIPEKGSVGASGDLTPLSYIGGVMQGERRVFYKGELHTTESVYKKLGIEPYRLKPKEGLALMNGTSVMTGIASNAYFCSDKIARVAAKLTGLLAEVLHCRSTPFHERLHSYKPHEGQKQAAKAIYDMIALPETRYARRAGSKGILKENITEHFRLQDSYSIRCSPHVIGVLWDNLIQAKKILEVEINSVNDNPIIDDESELILNGGHFYGGHIASICDTLKVSVANVAGLIERQLAILIDSRLNGGDLPANLVARSQLGNKALIHHGFKAIQITSTALVVEALKQSNPVSIHSRTTECLNQDVVSLGTIAARDLKQVNGLAARVLAIQAMALRQAAYLQGEQEFLAKLNDSSRSFLEELMAVFEPVIEDRPLDEAIEDMTARLFSLDREI